MTSLQVVQKYYPKVTSVVDATKSIVVEVTKRDANSKAVKDQKECALAMACKRALKVDGAIICIKTAYLIKGQKAYRYTNPESVSREVVAFDREAAFEPGIYHLQRVSPANRQGAKRGGGHHPRTGKGMFNTHRTENVRAIGEL